MKKEQADTRNQDTGNVSNQKGKEQQKKAPVTDPNNPVADARGSEGQNQRGVDNNRQGATASESTLRKDTTGKAATTGANASRENLGSSETGYKQEGSTSKGKTDAQVASQDQSADDEETAADRSEIE